MLIPIDSNVVAVTTAVELRTVLEQPNDYTHIYLADNITLDGGIAILPEKQEITWTLSDDLLI